MPRWTETWLEGPGVTLRELRNPGSWAGQKSGFPREGTGSLAPMGVRAAGFVVDTVLCAVVAAPVLAFLDDPNSFQRQVAPLVVLFLEQLLLVALTGATVGMRVMSTTVLHLKDETRVPGFGVALGRTILLVGTLGILGLFTKDGRGLHDVLVGSAVVRREPAQKPD